MECVDSATLSSFLFLFGNDARIAPACLPVIAGAKERQKDGDRKTGSAVVARVFRLPGGLGIAPEQVARCARFFPIIDRMVIDFPPHGRSVGFVFGHFTMVARPGRRQ
ncbi:MAG TPA: hypothetical protein VGX76_14270 [Pirellulales bacterium]|nr:hypothetical protein [Pirellulales bacterium]